MMAVTSESLTVGSRRGRPRSPERGASVTVWVTERTHATLVAQARARRVSLSGLVRQYVVRIAQENEPKQ